MNSKLVSLIGGSTLVGLTALLVYQYTNQKQHFEPIDVSSLSPMEKDLYDKIQKLVSTDTRQGELDWTGIKRFCQIIGEHAKNILDP